jgi:hypothetical protein
MIRRMSFLEWLEIDQYKWIYNGEYVLDVTNQVYLQQ